MAMKMHVGQTVDYSTQDSSSKKPRAHDRQEEEQYEATSVLGHETNIGGA